jgi:predicted PurR-regulated permease PerM
MAVHSDTSDRKPILMLSERQNGIVAAGITVLCAALVTAFAAFILWGLYALLSAVSVVLTPLLVSLILTLIFRPYYRWLWLHLRRKHWLAIPVFFLSILVPLGALLFFFGALLVNQLIALIAYLPALAENCRTCSPARSPTSMRFWRNSDSKKS